MRLLKHVKEQIWKVKKDLVSYFKFGIYLIFRLFTNIFILLKGLSEDVVELDDDEVDEEDDSFFDDNMSIITADSNTTNSTNSTQRGPMDKFAVRKPSKSQERKWWYVILKATISNGWSFRWVENKDSQEMFTCLNPNLKLPTRKRLSGKILTNASLDIAQSIEKKAKMDEIGVTLTLDGWTNVINQNLLGSVLITSNGDVLVWKAEDVSTERSRKEEVQEKIEELTKSVKDAGIKISAIVTDSAAQYASAR